MNTSKFTLCIDQFKDENIWNPALHVAPSSFAARHVWEILRNAHSNEGLD